jgi:ATP-dependent helicase/nuclease subunit A
MSEAGQNVRVMTAHKAKGLEANIVFLIDAHRPADTNKIGPLLTIEAADGADIPAIALAGARRIEVLSTAAARERRLKRDEYRRLLYVAATRARDRLYICGCERGNSDPHKPPPAEKSWHALAEDAFADLGGDIVTAGERFGARVRRLQSAQTAAIAAPERSPEARADISIDPALLHPAPAETRIHRLSPSQLIAAQAPDPAYSPLQGDAPFIRGRILHKLLQHLPGIVAPERRNAADRLLSHYADVFGEGARAEMREEAMAVLEDSRLAEVFGPGGMAEVAIGGRPAGAREGLVLSGQIDRLAFCGDRILIVDYKTNRPPPSRVEDAPLAYIAQMAAYRALLQEIYPGRKVEAALLWTYEARLMPIPDDALDRAHALTLA